MLKQKGPGYTAQMKAKVNYPKLKSKDDKNAKKTESIKVEITRDEKENIATSVPKVKDDNIPDVAGQADTKESLPKPAANPAESPVIIRKETVTISRKPPPTISKENKLPTNNPNNSNRSSIDEETADHSSDEAMDEESPLKKLHKKSSLTRGPGTFRKRSTFVKQMSDKAVPTKDDVVAFVENETIFDSQEHRKVILELVTNYTKDVRKKQLLSILEHPVFEDTACLEEVVGLLQDFVRNKSNNNNYY
jgi:hypothetical protein